MHDVCDSDTTCIKPQRVLSMPIKLPLMPSLDSVLCLRLTQIHIFRLLARRIAACSAQESLMPLAPERS